MTSEQIQKNQKAIKIWRRGCFLVTKCRARTQGTTQTAGIGVDRSGQRSLSDAEPPGDLRVQALFDIAHQRGELSSPHAGEKAPSGPCQTSPHGKIKEGKRRTDEERDKEFVANMRFNSKNMYE